MMNIRRFLLIIPVFFALAGCAGKDMLLSDQAFEELSKGNDIEAGKKLEQALSINPDNPYALLNMGVVYHRTGQADKARKMYEKVIVLQPKTRAESSNIESFSGTSLARIAEANLKLLKDGAAALPAPVPEPGPAPVSPHSQETPAPTQKEEPAGEPKPAETLYRVREDGTLLDIAGRKDLYGDVLKWPSLFRLNMDLFRSTEDLLIKQIPKGSQLRTLTSEEASKRASVMGERLWVVNVTSVRNLGETALPAAMLMRRGYHVYLVRTELAGEPWISVRVGFYPSILEAMAACENIRPLISASGEVCVTKIDLGEFERNAGY